MPNWCGNKLIITGPDVRKILQEIGNGPDQPLSFNKVVPMPEVAAMSDGEHIQIAKAASLWRRGETDEANKLLGTPDGQYDTALPKIIATNYKIGDFFWVDSPKGDGTLDLDLLAAIGDVLFASTTPIGSWYEWRMLHWGTKWDLDSDVSVNILTPHAAILTFSTAWSPPSMFFKALVEKYPEYRFRLTYYEGGNWFAGCIQGLNGICDDQPSKYSDRRYARDMESCTIPAWMRWSPAKHAARKNKVKTKGA